jgi:hypothetical protein
MAIDLRLRLFSVLAVLAAAPLTSCRTPGLLCIRPSGLHDVEIASHADSNGGRAIAVDLVYVTAKPLAAVMSKLKARDYFALQDQLSRDYPQMSRTLRWELEAGQRILPTELSPPCNLAGTYLFANYQSDGDHRVVVGNVKAGVLNLGARGIVWTPK